MVDVPLARPTWVGTRRIERRHLVLLRLTDDGAVGWGEATPVPGWHPPPAEVAAALQRWLDGGVPLTGFGRAAVDAAMLDIAGQRAGRPVSGLLADDPLDAVPVNGLLDGGTPDEVAAAAEELAGRFAAVKLKVGGRAPEAEIVRIRAAAAALGPATRLRLDANRRWDLDTASRVLTALADLDLDHVEEPVPSIGDLAALRRRTPVPLALDETLVHDDIVDRVVAGRLADVLVLKPVMLGALGGTVDLARRAAAHGMGVVVTSALDGAVGTVTAIHVAAALPRPVQPCGLATGSFLRADVARAPDVVDGAIAVPRGPGLGISVALS